MKRRGHSVRLTVASLLLSSWVLVFPELIKAQWDPHYWVDETKRHTVTDVQIVLDETIQIGLEIRVKDAYYTFPGDFSMLEYPQDVTESIRNKAISFLASGSFEGKTIQEVLKEVAGHVYDSRAEEQVTVVFNMPPQFRGAPSFRLRMDAFDTRFLWTSIALDGDDYALQGSSVQRLVLTWKTENTQFIVPEGPRSLVHNFLKHHPVEPSQVTASNRLLAANIESVYGEILEVTSELTSAKSHPVADNAEFRSILTWSNGQMIAETVSIDMNRSEPGHDEPSVRHYRLVMDMAAGTEIDDYPDLANLHNLIITRITAFEPGVDDWEVFMKQSLEQIEASCGSVATHISFYMDSGSLRDNVNIRYLSRKGIPMFGTSTMYIGIELVIDSMMTFTGNVVRFELEIADFYQFMQLPIPDVDMLTDTLKRHAMHPYVSEELIRNEALLNRYLNMVAYEYGDMNYWDWKFLYNGTIRSEISGVDSEGIVFRHTLDGEAASWGKFAEGSEMPTRVQLRQNYPNPFNPATLITFEVGQPMEVTLEVFDITGRKVAEPATGMRDRGIHTVWFDARNLASGVYIARLIAGREVKEVKMVLLR